jgi:hypothetical protein
MLAGTYRIPIEDKVLDTLRSVPALPFQGDPGIVGGAPFVSVPESRTATRSPAVPSYRGPLSVVSSGPAGKDDVLLLWRTLLVKKYHSFIDKDSSQPAAEGTFIFEPRNVIGGCP